MSMVADILVRSGAVGFQFHSPITFKSGIKSPMYVDCRKLISDPIDRKFVAAKLATYITEIGDCDIVCGVATAGIPWASMVAHILDIPMIYCRTSTKEHGKKKLIEGDYSRGNRTVVIEDVISTGGSVLTVVNALKQVGLVVEKVFCLYDYGFPSRIGAFEVAGVDLHPLARLEDVVKAAGTRLDRDRSNQLFWWRADPQEFYSKSEEE